MNVYFKVFFLFFIISCLVLSGVVFNDKLVGRSLDFTVSPDLNLTENVYKNSFYQWWGIMNGGSRNTFSSTLIPINSILHIPLIFNAGAWFLARYQIVITIFLGMAFFYLLSSRVVKKNELDNWSREGLLIIASFFFTLNNYFFSEIVFGSNVMYLTFAFLPLLLYSVISFFEEGKNRYLVLTIFSMIIVSSTLQHLVVAYVFLFLLCSIYKKPRFFIKIGLIHLILSAYWILPLLYASKEISGNEMVANYTLGSESNSSFFSSSLLNSDYFGNRNMYRSALNSEGLSFIWTFNSALLVVFSFFGILGINNLGKKRRHLFLLSLIIFIFAVLFIKGSREPLGGMIQYLYENFPVFNLFRSLQRYTSFYVLSISMAFLISGLLLLRRNKKAIYFLGIMVALNSMPWWITRDLGRKNNVKYNNSAPAYFGMYELTKGDFDMYSLNLLKEDFHIMTIPPGYSVEFGKNSNINEKLQGVDAGLAYGNKGFYSVDSSSGSMKIFLTELEKQMYKENDFFNKNRIFFPFLNIRYFILRKDIAPVFSPNSDNFNFKSIDSSIKKADFISSTKESDYVTVIKNSDFLPHFYTPQNPIVSKREIENLPRIVSWDNWQIRSAVFFEGQNKGKREALSQIKKSKSQIQNSEIQNENYNLEVGQSSNEILRFAQNDKDLPILEFKKINSTKYRVWVHGASGVFPLVFSESYHDKWKSYLAGNSKIKDEILRSAQNDNLENYKILDGNEGDQADKNELMEYINNGWITTLGDGKKKSTKHYKWEDEQKKLDYVEKYNVDFISKNFQGTIQNDNLPSGSIFETWFKKPIDESNHLMANGYANSWVIDTETICHPERSEGSRNSSPTAQDDTRCIENTDGTYDFEMVVEFWPQRLFYIGMFISGMTFLGCIGYLAYDWKRNRKNRVRKE